MMNKLEKYRKELFKIPFKYINPGKITHLLVIKLNPISGIFNSTQYKVNYDREWR